MRTDEKITDSQYILTFVCEGNGGRGEVKLGSVVWRCEWDRDCNGWEHVAIYPIEANRFPRQREMGYLRNIFFTHAETVIEVYPPREYKESFERGGYHLWKPISRSVHKALTDLIGRVADGKQR